MNAGMKTEWANICIDESMNACVGCRLIHWLHRQLYIENLNSTELYFQAIMGGGYRVF